MRCPNDNNELRIADRQGVEIDYCPECRGVWLDRGELDKIIERSAALEAGLRQQQQPQPAPYGGQTQQFPPQYQEQQYQGQPQPYGRPDYDDDDYRERGYEGYPRKRKREGFLSELFDFD